MSSESASDSFVWYEYGFDEHGSDEYGPDEYCSDKYGPDQYDASNICTTLQCQLCAGQPRSVTRSGFVRPRSSCDFASAWNEFILRAGHHDPPFDSIAIHVVCSSFGSLSNQYLGATLCADEFGILNGFPWSFRPSTDSL